MPRLLRLALLAPILLLAVGCGDSGTTPGGDDDGPGDGVGVDPQPDPVAETYCGRLGFSCNAADVPEEVFDRSEDLLRDVKARSEGGEDNASLAAWLEDQDGVAYATATDGAVVFRVRGGQPTWLLTPDFTDTEASAPVADPTAQDVVGHGTPRENPEKRKRALVLAPYLFQFGSNDPSPTVRTMLQGVRDYSHGEGVRFVANTTAPGRPSGDAGLGQPTVEDFKGWEAYDVISVATHGSEMTEDSFSCTGFSGLFFCMAGVSTGERIRSCSVIRTRYPDTPGIRCASSSGVDGVFFLVDTEFFRAQYSVFNTGLDKAIVYMGGCQTLKNGSIAWELGGSRSEYFGWDDNVIVREMGAPAIRLFRNMLTDGLSSEDAYEELEDAGVHETTQATLLYEGNDDGLHIREITTLKNPMKPASGSFVELPWSSGPLAQAADDPDDLLDGDVIPFLGQAGDGENDRLLFDVEVDGVTAQNESEIDVTVTVDGEELGTWPLTGERAKRIDDNTVRVRIIQPVAFDIQDGQAIELKAKANLPGDGESEDEVNPRLENPVLHVESMIRTTGGELSITSRVEGEIPITFEEGENQDELKLGESEGPLEYVSFDLEFDDPPPGCSITSSTTDGRIGIAEGEVSFDDPSAPDFGLPEELVLIVYPEIEERLLFICNGFAQGQDLIHWFAGFASFHGGQLGGANELDEARGGWVIRGWEPADDAFARKVYDRSGTEEDVTLTEMTTFEIRGPSYADGG